MELPFGQINNAIQSFDTLHNDFLTEQGLLRHGCKRLTIVGRVGLVVTSLNRSTKLVIVLGIGRSGTSAIARSLRVLGVELGDNTTPPEPGVNDAGFWEDADLLAVDCEALSFLGSDWMEAPVPISEGDVSRLAASGFLERATDLVGRKTANAEIFGLKDGRVTKLLPFWRRAFKAAEIGEVLYVIAIRNPVSVANSYHTYLKTDRRLVVRLWADYVQASLRMSRGHRRVIVDFDNFLSHPEAELRRMGRKLGLAVVEPELETYVTDFLDADLRHHGCELGDFRGRDDIPDVIKEMYVWLLRHGREKTLLDRAVTWLIPYKWAAQIAFLESVSEASSGRAVAKAIPRNRTSAPVP